MSTIQSRSEYRSLDTIVRERMSDKGIKTLTALAKLSHLGQSDLSQILLDKKLLGETAARRLASALDCDADMLIKASHLGRVSKYPSEQMIRFGAEDLDYLARVTKVLPDDVERPFPLPFLLGLLNARKPP